MAWRRRQAARRGPRGRPHCRAGPAALGGFPGGIRALATGRYNLRMNSRQRDQQPIARTVGRRTQAPAGAPPSREARAAMDSLAKRLTRATEGVFRYASHDEMAQE